MSWFNTGYGQQNSLAKEVEIPRGLDRFWMKTGEKKEVLFVGGANLKDLNEPARYEEVHPILEGKYDIYFTVDENIVSDAELMTRFGGAAGVKKAAAWTIVDCSAQRKDAQGNLKTVPQLKLLVAPSTSMKTIAIENEDAKAEKRSGVAGNIYVVRRSADKMARVGDIFKWNRTPDQSVVFNVTQFRGKNLSVWYDEAEQSADGMAKLEKFLVPFRNSDGTLDRTKLPLINVVEQLKPLSVARLKAIVKANKIGEKAANAVESGKAGNSSIGGEEEVPF